MAKDSIYIILKISNYLIKKQTPLIAIILVGFMLRILNPTFGSPVIHVIGDEVSNYMSALYMLSQKTILSTSSQYTPFGAYIQIPFLAIAYVGMLFTGNVGSLSDFEFFLATHEGYFLFIPRILSGIFGALTIPVVYRLSQTIFPKKNTYALWSAIFFSLSLTHIQYSHEGRPWAIALFFFTLSALYTIKSNLKNAEDRSSPAKAIFFTIIAAGFFSQIGVVALYFFLLTRLAYLGKSKDRTKSLGITIAGAITIILSMISFQHLVTFTPTVNFLFSISATDISSFSHLFYRVVNNNAIVFFVSQLFVMEPLLMFFSLLFSLQKIAWEKLLSVLTFFIISYIIFAGLFFYQAGRYILPVIPLLCLYAAAGFSFVLSRQNRVLKTSLTLLVIIGLSILPLLWMKRFLEVPTFILARQWIETGIAPDVAIASTSYRYIGFTPGYNAITFHQTIDPGAFTRAKNYLRPNVYPDNVRSIYYTDAILKSLNVETIVTFLKKQNIHYMIDYHFTPESYLVQEKGKKAFTLVAQFSPLVNKKKNDPLSNLYATMENPFVFLLATERGGPYVDIFLLND